MLRIFTITGLILSIACGQAIAETTSGSPVCYNDKVSSTAGLNIRMNSGLIYQAYPGSLGKISMWTPLDKVNICRLGGASYQITNLSNKGPSVKALRN